MSKEIEVKPGRLDLLAMAFVEEGFKRIEEKTGLRGIRDSVNSKELERLVKEYIPERIEDPVINMMVKVLGKNLGF